MCHAIRLINTGKVENAVQVTKALQDIKTHPISSQTVCRHLKKSGMKAVVKKKCPLLFKRHRKERLDFAILEDELQQSLEYFNKSPEDILFQQDNDPKHTSRKAKNWFEDHDYEVMVTGAMSEQFPYRSMDGTPALVCEPVTSQL
ncbi:hypothetical protein PAXINDRAFT_22424 [Paxillus involutus ATCC 200175]|uniref:Transposase Tc1-like domain-containing protein n=1 Tax=Paxillus involutus ATCC 200175 TaxID=664439 RepID=A0A0C9SYZ9_PAXIN|nr:hypothetical protein PAXINDRAFT_22424 [Paxillus involutus ATCC 200175]